MFESLRARGSLRPRQGSAVGSVVGGAAVASVFVLGLLNTTEPLRPTNAASARARAEAAAESALSLAASRVWTAFEAARPPGRDASLDELVAFLDDRGLGTWEEPADVSGQLGLPRNELGELSLSGAVIEAVRVRGRTRDRRVELEVSARVRAGRTHAVERATFVAERDTWDGSGYALLAGDLGCLVCHLEVDAADRVDNLDPARFGSFQHVRVGSLAPLRLRGSARSWIAGALHVGGPTVDANGSPVRDWSVESLLSRAWGVDGTLLEDEHGALQPAPFVPPLPGADRRIANLVEDPAARAELGIPDAIPSPFPDDGGYDGATRRGRPDLAGNRTVDEIEFEAIARRATGSVRAPLVALVARGESVGSREALERLQGAGSIGPRVPEHALLQGTRDAPVHVDGEVAFRGDLILIGPVEGRGTLRVAGNVYLPSDLRAARAPGLDSIAIAAAGSIVIGDLHHPRWGRGNVTGDSDGSFSFAIDQIALFNREEWTRTQAVLPSRGQRFDAPGTWTAPNPGFAGPNHVPRYWSFDGESPVPVLADGWFDTGTDSWRGREHVGGWRPKRMLLGDPTDPSDPLLFDAEGVPRAHVRSLTPTDGWLSPEGLRSLARHELARRDPGEELRIDASLYSSACVLGIVPTERRARGTDGRLCVRGCLIAPHVGLLAPHRLRILYDPGSASLLDVPLENRLVLKRIASDSTL